ncbi:hypothetical protein NL676_033723 [Syzygium grande]|nr:hypothetical protein NL676_033723 [Syzygium grande]
MNATAVAGQDANYSDWIFVWTFWLGDEMRRGISGGQKKCLTTGEMLASLFRKLNLDPRINESTLWVIPKLSCPDEDEAKKAKSDKQKTEGIDMAVKSTSELLADSEKALHRGMVLPFQPLSLAFNHVNYYVDMPDEMKNQGIEEDCLQLLRDVSDICTQTFKMFVEEVMELVELNRRFFWHQIAAIVMSFFLSFWNLFSGFLIPRPQIPVWWRASDMQLKVFLKEELGFDYNFLPAVAVAYIMWVLFFFVFAYGIKFLNFQRR